MRSILIDDRIKETLRRHGDWLRVALDSWRFSLNQLVSHPVKCKLQTLAARPAVLPQVIHKWTPLWRALRRGFRSFFQEKRVSAWTHDKHHYASGTRREAAAFRACRVGWAVVVGGRGGGGGGNPTPCMLIRRQTYVCTSCCTKVSVARPLPSSWRIYKDTPRTGTTLRASRGWNQGVE